MYELSVATIYGTTIGRLAVVEVEKLKGVLTWSRVAGTWHEIGRLVTDAKLQPYQASGP